MKTQQTIIAATLLLGSLLLLPAAQAADSTPFHFWFQRDGACVGCAQMPPPGTPEAFPQLSGIDVMFNGYDQTTSRHWQNQGVESYQFTYTYKLDRTTRSVTQTAHGDAASIVIKPYAVADVNKALV